MNETKEQLIRRSIDKIEPAEGAKERMLANIRQKAAAQAAAEAAKEQAQKAGVSKTASFSRLRKWALPAAACLVIAVAGAALLPGMLRPAETAESEPAVMLVNPFAEVENADAFEEVLGFRADAPTGAEDVTYNIIDKKIADVCFVWAGREYDLRAAAMDGDFSGLYGEEAESEVIDAERAAVLTVLQSGDESYKKIEWSDGKVNYVLMNTDGAAKEELTAVYGLVR